MDQVRPAAVAGYFYPGESNTLSGTVRRLLEDAQASSASGSTSLPKAIVVPHAGYVYSGPIAASAYARLVRAGAAIRRVVLLGPTHRVAVQGVATPEASAFETPLGVVELDQPALRSIADLPCVVPSAAAHAFEHALEVQLPFLQTVLNEFKLVPLAVGDARASDVAMLLERLWGGVETLIVISSDLSHYLPYVQAQRVDAATAKAVLDFAPQLDHAQACGATPLNGLLLAAQRKALRAELLDLRNSGDTAGDRARVVGYASFAFYESAHAH